MFHQELHSEEGKVRLQLLVQVLDELHLQGFKYSDKSESQENN